jgi:hypothetical protein
VHGAPINRRKHPRLYMKFPNFKINMGFGLHHGWAIEGASLDINDFVGRAG